MARALEMANSTITELTSNAKALTEQIEADKPKVVFADAVSGSEDSILVGELAKLITQNGVNIGPLRLFEWLRENGYLMRRKTESHNLPTQRSMERGLFEIKETVYRTEDGRTATKRTPKVTGKGQLYFVKRFVNEKIEKQLALE
jgi:anti-repressor protein